MNSNLQTNNNNKNDNINSLAIKAGLFYVISAIVVRGMSVITTPIFARLLSKSEYGVTSTFISWHVILSMICCLNLNASIGRAKIDFEKRLDEYIGSMQILSLIVSATISGGLLLFSEELSGYMEMPASLIILLAIYLFFEPIIKFFQCGYRYRYKYKENIAIAFFLSFGSVAVSLILICLTPMDKAVGRTMGLIVPTVILSLLFWTKSIKQKSICVNLHFWKYALRISIPLVANSLSMNILSQADRIFISKYCGQDATGIYSLAYTYGLAMTIVTTNIAEGWQPWFHDKYHLECFDEIRKATSKIVVLGCFICMAVVCLAPEGIWILGGEGYEEGVVCVLPIALGVLCQYIYTYYVNIQIHLKKTYFVPIGTAIAAGLNLILNYWLIPLFGYVAAAYTTLISYLILMIGHFIITRFILKVKVYNDWFMFGAILITGIISYLLTYLYSMTVIRYVVCVIGFSIFVYLYREYILTSIEKFLKKINKRQ